MLTYYKDLRPLNSEETTCLHNRINMRAMLFSTLLGSKVDKMRDMFWLNAASVILWRETRNNRFKTN